MKGRYEHSLKIKNNITKLLDGADQFLTGYYYIIQVSKEPTTCLEYIRKIKRFLDSTGKKANAVTSVDIAKYFMEINDTVDTDGVMHQASFAYKKGVWSALNSFYNWMYKNKLMDVNPMESIDRPNSFDNVSRYAPDINDLNSILDSVKNGVGNSRAHAKQREWKERDMLIMFLFMSTGMRKTALSEINVEDISFESNELTVIDKRHKIQTYNITDELRTMLSAWLLKREEILDGAKEDALFISFQKKRMSEKAIYNIVQKYSEDALGFKISPHKLRRAFVTLYYEASGHDLKATCEAVGHASVSTTSLYIVKRNNSRADAQNFMSKRLKV